MKKVLLPLTALFAMAIAAAPGCSGGGDDDDDDDDDGALASGEYAVSNADVADTCGGTFYGDGSSYYGGVDSVDVTVVGASVEISGFPNDLVYDISGTDLIDTEAAPQAIDFRDPETLESGNTYDCTLIFSFSYLGEITGTNEFTLVDTYMVSSSSGSECAIAADSGFGVANTLPCQVEDSVDLAL